MRNLFISFIFVCCSLSQSLSNGNSTQWSNCENNQNTYSPFKYQWKDIPFLRFVGNQNMAIGVTMIPLPSTGPHLLPLVVTATVSGAAMPINVNCILKYSLVRFLGNNFAWNTMDIPMTGTYPDFTATLPASPGLYEFGCQCFDVTGGMDSWSTTINNNGWAFMPPTNDECTNAESLSNGATVGGTNGGASSQAGENVPGGISPFASVWYSYTLTAPDQTIEIDVSPNGTLPIISPIIGVYSGTCFGVLEATGPGPHCLEPGTYLIQVASLDINQGSFDITVTSGASPVMPTIAVTENNGSNDGNVCIGADFTLTVSPAGAAGYTWALDGTPIVNAANIWSIPSSTIANDGTYSVTVTDAMGCTGSTSITVNIFSLPTANVATLATCETTVGSGTGDFTLADADLTVLNGQTGMTVSYHANAGDATANVGPLTSPYNSTSGTVYARVTDVYCYAISVITLTVNPLPTGVQIQNINNSNSPADFTICAGAPINLSVAGTGTGTLQYSWDLPGGTDTGSPLNIAMANNPTHSGTWIVTVTDANGCTATDNINITVDPAPSNDECANALPYSNAGDNTCASEDITTCGANGEASVWYDYTVPAGIKTLTFTFTGLAGGVINIYDGCGGASIGTTCSTSVMIDCPTEGDILKIYVSSPSASAGPFTLNASETPATVANDDCSGAISIPDSPVCQFFPVAGSTSVGACPEDITVGGCGLDFSMDAIVWYEFTPPTGTTSVQFQNVVGTLGVFTSCPATTFVAGGGCITGATMITVAAGTTYYVGIGVPGGSGPVGFDIRYNAGPANDDCANALPFSTSGDNSCATEDITTCGANGEASVWYDYTVPAGIKTLTFTLSGLTGGVINVYDGCGGASIGTTCSTLVMIDCPTEGDILKIYVSSPSASAGPFTLSTSETPATVANDDCSGAISIPDSPVCEFFPVAGSTSIGACPEDFTVGGCGLDYSMDAIVWYEFTPPAGTTSVQFQNVIGTLSVFTGCPATTVAAGGGCITGAGTVNVTVGATYYIGIGVPGGSGPVGFDIRYNAGPANDTPCTAESIGTATQNSTCCANQEIASPCGVGTESSVWYEVQTGPNVVSVDVTFANTSMTAPFVVDIFSGPDCSSLSILPDDVFKSPCNTGSFTANIRCQDFATNSLFIRVGSNAATCGTFSLSAVTNSGSCAAASDCAAAPSIAVPTGGQTCLPGCNESFCGDGFCDPNGNATYYSFTFDASTASAAVITINDASFSPIISIAYDCFSPFVSCFTGAITNPFPIGSGTIYVRVEAAGGMNLDDDFTVCANAFDAGSFDCYGATLDVTRPEHPNEDQTGPYCSGEVVHFCYNVNFIVSAAGTVPPDGNNCQWLQGIVPVVYEGWDLDALPLSGQAAPGGSSWYDEAEVHYNFSSPQYSPVTLPNGNLGLTWGAGGLAAGGDMPAGWYWASPGSGADCTDGSNPDTAWGLPGACGSLQSVSICFDLKVKEFETQAECEGASLKVVMFSFADGELGCWTNLSCAQSTPLTWQGFPACNTLITVEGDDKETCSGVPVLVTAVASDPAANIILTTIDNPNVTGETLSGTYPFGQMNLLETLINTSNAPQIVEYIVYGTIPGQVCQSPPISIFVTVYPELEGTFIPDPAYVCNPGDCINITINPMGGTGNYVDFQWSGQGVNGSGATVQVCPTTPTDYSVTFTDDLGCQGIESVEVDIKDPVTAVIDPSNIAVCKDGIEGNADPIYGNVTSGLAPYNLVWTPPSGINGYGGPFLTLWDDRFFLLEESSQATSGTLLLTVTDSWGCTGTATASISVDEGPAPVFSYLPIACGSSMVDLVGTYNIGQSYSSFDRFELYNCDYTYIADGNTEIFTFEDIDLSTYGTCFKLLTYTTGGCVVERTLNVTTISGTQVLLAGNTERCSNGATSQISVNNPTAFSSFIWSNGATTPDITISPSITTTYVVTATQSNGCTSTASRTITVHPAPTVSYSGSTAICPGQSTTLTGTSDITGSTFVWTNLGNNTTSNGASITTSAAGNYSLTVSTPFNCTTILYVTVTVGNSLSPNINELSLCDGSNGVLDAGGGFDLYLWNTGESTQTIQVSSGGQYWVDVSQSTCFGSDTVTVINNLTPTLNISPTPLIVCRTNDGFGPSSINFTTQINPPNVLGNWREITGSGVDFTTDPSNVSFLGIAAGSYQFEYTTSGAMNPCSNVVDTLFVTVNACQCPQILPTGPYCNQGSAPVDMKTKKGNPALGGTFSIISPVGITMVNDIFNPTGLQAGTYIVQWDLTPNCQPTTNIVVYDDPVATLTTTQTTICNDNATGSTMLDVNTLLAASSSIGTWKLVSGPASAFTAPSTINGTGLAKDEVLTVRYITNTAQSPCKNDSIDLKIVVRDCKCPDVMITPLSLCNGDNTLIDLNSSTILTTTPVGITGVWSSNISGAITSGRFLNVFGKPTGSYQITFTLSNPIAGCTNSVPAPVTIALQPVAEVERKGTACNINSGNGPTTVRLYDLLKNGYTTSGVWTQTSGSPSLPISASGVVDFVAQPVGAIFKFTYTRNATSPCTPVSVEVEITISDCQCPAININNPGPLCNSNGLLDLNTLEGIPNSPGFWLVRNPIGNIINTPSDILDAKNLSEGIYKLTYSLVPAPSGTCQKDSTVILKIENQNTAVTKDTMVCNTVSSSGPSSLDFRALLVSTTGIGKWLDKDLVEIPNFTNVSYIGSPLGTINYYYEVASTVPCVNIKIPTNVEVIDCSCEQIVLGQIPSICTSSATFDLRPFSDAKPGTWKSNNPLIVITNGVLNLSNMPAALYDIYYELNTPLPAPCPSTKIVTINIFNPKNAGTARGAEYCVGATDVVSLFDRLDNEDSGGTWTVVNGGSAGFNAQNGTFTLTGRPSGSYVFRYSFTGQAPCPDDQEDVTIRINDLPIADAGLDKTLNCTIQSAILGTSLSSVGPNIIYEWKLANDIVSNQMQHTVLQGGIFTLTVRDTVTKCAASDNVTVILEDDLPLFDVSVDTIACFGQTASIRLSNIRGGQPPYQISFNGGITYGSTTSTSNLKTGNYKIMVKDANGCINDRWPEIKIIEPPIFTVNLGQDLIFNLGDDTLLTIVGQYNPLTALSVTWYANGIEITSNKNLPTLLVKPTDDTEYTVTITNQSACIATDVIRITIRKVKPECIPNIINTESISGNSYFSINCGEVEMVTKYSIYDRWGNLLFFAKDLSPSNPQSFWNGSFKNKPVVPGVYVYNIELLFKDGSIENRAGDVTVMR
ncbi:MAG: gliding motility-associated C-terminal domain-containing protein [Saprospiraceae bacterium]|nr:gliding motility-associated C-terminal domain-containing protein [Saprospiraceae bacterium]